jgi:transcriptional regulator
MAILTNMFLPVGKKQLEFWELRRNGLPNINIAQQFKISRQAVSRALITIDERIKETLLEMALLNKIKVENINVERGFLLGHSIPFNANAIIFVSVKHGLQVWYEHEGKCGQCDQYAQCLELLWDFADEMGIKLEKANNPTKLAEELFIKLRELV